MRIINDLMNKESILFIVEKESMNDGVFKKPFHVIDIPEKSGADTI